MCKTIELICWKCHRPRQLRPADHRKAIAQHSPCRHCQQSAAGKLGAKATERLYGADYLLEVIRHREAEAPSVPESALREMLHNLGAAFETQVIFKSHNSSRKFILDIVLDNGTVIECNGYWHKRLGAERDRELARQWSAHVEFVDADDIIYHPCAVEARLRELISL